MTDKQRVILVDDDPEVAWGLGRYMARHGYAVSTCTDGSQALKLLESKEFDVLVTDVQVPHVNGLALLDWARTHRPRMHVAVMTAFGSPAVRQASLSHGAMLYLEKPVDPELLVRTLAERPTEAFSGSVDQIDLFDYVQVMLFSRRQAVLEVASREGATGRLWLARGDVTHAVCGTLEGEAAFFACLAFKGGSFATRPWADPERASITRPGQFLLMEAARLKDEAGQAPPGTGEPASGGDGTSGDVL